MNPQELVVVKTLCYADVFDFPLKEEELRKYEIRNTKYETNSIFIIPNSKFYRKSNNYFVLRGREKLIQHRKLRERYSREKLQKAQRYTRFLRLIPSVKLVAITGALAMENADRDDDIDLLIVTAGGLVWTTRLLCVLLIELIGVRRRPADQSVQDKVCLNMFIDEDHLAVPPKERDLFSAHEVAQIKILWSRGEAARRFYERNRWIKKYLPKALGIRKLRNYEIKPRESNFAISLFRNFVEGLSRSLQLWYMKHRRTSEVISDGYLRFHPRDVRGWVLGEYRKRLRKVGLE